MSYNDKNSGQRRSNTRSEGRSYSKGGYEGRAYSRGKSTEGKTYTKGGYGAKGKPAYSGKDGYEKKTYGGVEGGNRYDPYVMRGAKPLKRSETGRKTREEGERKTYRMAQRTSKPLETEEENENKDEMLLIGKNAVWEALKAGRSIERLYLAQGIDETTVQGILGISNREKIKVERAPRNRLTEIAGTEKHQGVVAYLSAMDYTPLDTMLDNAFEETENPIFILLDEVQDPHNLGAVIRTADCAGVNGVIILEHRSVGLTATVAKVSAGALAHVPVAKVTNLVRAMEQLQERGVTLYGAAMGGISCYECDFADRPIGLVIGNEGMGIRRLVQEKCDVLTGIPIYGHVDSLNASVAAAVLMFEAVRQRKSAK